MYMYMYMYMYLYLYLYLYMYRYMYMYMYIPECESEGTPPLFNSALDPTASLDPTDSPCSVGDVPRRDGSVAGHLRRFT